jgi:hypothetical protein
MNFCLLSLSAVETVEPTAHGDVPEMASELI